ncbi:MAG: hypothetical protein MHM6MM_005182 [Cercozoa sp. M6MM]
MRTGVHRQLRPPWHITRRFISSFHLERDLALEVHAPYAFAVKGDDEKRSATSCDSSVWHDVVAFDELAVGVDNPAAFGSFNVFGDEEDSLKLDEIADCNVRMQRRNITGKCPSYGTALLREFRRLYRQRDRHIDAFFWSNLDRIYDECKPVETLRIFRWMSEALMRREDVYQLQHLLLRARSYLQWQLTPEQRVRLLDRHVDDVAAIHRNCEGALRLLMTRGVFDRRRAEQWFPMSSTRTLDTLLLNRANVDWSALNRVLQHRQSADIMLLPVLLTGSLPRVSGDDMGDLRVSRASSSLSELDACLRFALWPDHSLSLALQILAQIQHRAFPMLAALARSLAARAGNGGDGAPANPLTLSQVLQQCRSLKQYMESIRDNAAREDLRLCAHARQRSDRARQNEKLEWKKRIKGREILRLLDEENTDEDEQLPTRRRRPVLVHALDDTQEDLLETLVEKWQHLNFEIPRSVSQESLRQSKGEMRENFHLTKPKDTSKEANWRAILDDRDVSHLEQCLNRNDDETFALRMRESMLPAWSRVLECVSSWCDQMDLQSLSDATRTLLHQQDEWPVELFQIIFLSTAARLGRGSNHRPDVFFASPGVRDSLQPLARVARMFVRQLQRKRVFSLADPMRKRSSPLPILGGTVDMLLAVLTLSNDAQSVASLLGLIQEGRLSFPALDRYAFLHAMSACIALENNGNNNKATHILRTQIDYLYERLDLQEFAKTLLWHRTDLERGLTFRSLLLRIAEEEKERPATSFLRKQNSGNVKDKAQLAQILANANATEHSRGRQLPEFAQEIALSAANRWPH